MPIVREICAANLGINLPTDRKNRVFWAPATKHNAAVLTPGDIFVSGPHRDDLLDLCRGRLKYGSSVRVPDSGNRINSTEIVAKYDEFEGFYLRGYTEVGDPVLASIVEIHKSSRNDLPSCPRISRYI